ncbi:MAG: alkaline phosphatase family protein [Actinobacteria bacterium]|nr:alkaline phosphatase family protein [Actinomycetota bacterium]MCA1720992.1 alkaline phosphatase family protein [Actinomycetota bacterium]
MPLPSRDHAAAQVVPGSDGYLRDRALDVLLDPDLSNVVALVAWLEKGLVHVADARGHVALGRDGSATVLAGRDPIADQDPLSETGYPFAAARLQNLFRDSRAPDLAVVHTGTHHWPERGGHLGEHGSLNALQSRAPLVLSGPGVQLSGLVDEVVRTIDVGATLTFLSGGGCDGMEGRPIPAVQPGARYVVGLLWDGAQCADLLELAATGELPNVARLIARGCAFRGGAIAEFPSVTLVNHTSALTGVGPGTHGIVNNAFYDRATGEQVVPNSSANWHRSMQWLRPGVRTVFERLPADIGSACVNEPCDVGATYSTFALVRETGKAGTGTLADWLPSPEGDPHATHEHVRADGDYAWATQVDAVGLEQVLGLWREAEPPRLMWWNTTLTDSGHHAGGPGSDIARSAMRDADRRLGVWLDLVEERALLDDTLVLLTADHGMQGADPAVTGDWDDALTAAGVPYRDEAYGFLYLGNDVLPARPENTV